MEGEPDRREHREGEPGGRAGAVREALDPEKAIAAFEAVRKAATPETEILELLAKHYSAKPDKLAGVLADLAARLPDDLRVRLQLAKLHAAAGRHAEAEQWAREVLFVDVTHAEGKGILVAALQAQKKDADAEKIEKRYKP